MPSEKKSQHNIKLLQTFKNIKSTGKALRSKIRGLSKGLISPDGIRTALTIETDNQLSRITYLDGSYHEFDYTSGSLMTWKFQKIFNADEMRYWID